jgi:hypothetical protein
MCHAKKGQKAITEAEFDLINSYSEAGVAHADLPIWLHIKKKNPQENKNLPPSASPSVALISCCVLLFHDRSPAQLLAGEIGPSG